MADNNPNLPGGVIPPRPPEASKIQPKKETVRINLPPKPSAAPTIKLPTLPPGGPATAAAAPSLTPHAPAPALVPAARSGAAPVAAPAGQRPIQRPVAPPRAPVLSPLDQGLAIAAAVIGLLALGTTIYCWTLFTPN